MAFDRITYDPLRMGGKPCIRGLRVTVGMVVGLLAQNHPRDEILRAYPYLEAEDLDQSLAYAAWQLLPPAPAAADEWERQLFGAARDCGVSVPDAALGSDGLYE